MAKTNLQRNAAFYARLIKEAKESPNSEKYKAVCEALEKLVGASDTLKAVNHKMSQVEYTNLVKEYNGLQQACQTYLNSDNFNEFEKKHKRIITDIANVAAMDMGVLEKCDPINPGTLSDIMDKSRTETVFLTKKNLPVVGAALSSRFPILTNSGKKGFFTVATKFNLDKDWQKSLEKYEGIFSKVSETCKERLQMLKTDGDFQARLAKLIPDTIYERKFINSKPVKIKMVQLAQVLGMGENTDDIVKLFKENKDLYGDLFKYCNSIVDLSNRQRVMDNAGIKKDSNISSRNCAMTDMAKLMGCSHLLANSVPMKVDIDGLEVEGVFMEAAEGTDLNRLKENDPIFQADFNSFENPVALQQIVDLQVLDFVCGNIDRHMGNMIYQFKKKTFGGVKFTGIKGIDNDCAFGTLDVNSGKNISNLVNVNNMKFITTDMAASLEKITEPMLKMKLAHHHLSSDEIKAAWGRLVKVRDAAKSGQLTIIDKSYWSKNPLSKYKGTSDYIEKFKAVQGSCAKENAFKEEYESEEPSLEGSKTIKYAQEKVTAAEIMVENANNILALRKKMDDSSSIIFGSSEYKLMKSSFEKIEKYTKEVKGYKNIEQVPIETTNALRNAYIEMAKKTEQYIALKKIVPSTEKGEMRLNFAKDLKASADFMLNKLNIYLDKDAEKEIEAVENVEEAPEM